MHFPNLFSHDGVDIFLGGQAEVELSSGHEVEGKAVGEGREQARSQIVQRQKSHCCCFVTLKWFFNGSQNNAIMFDSFVANLCNFVLVCFPLYHDSNLYLPSLEKYFRQPYSKFPIYLLPNLLFFIL